MSSQPTNQPQTYETTLSPYPPSNTMAPGSPPPLGFTHPTKQAQSAQPPFFGSPGIITKSQQGQGNIQMVNPATGAATTNFREEAKILGAIQILIGLMHIGFRIILGLMDAIYGLVFAFLSFAFISGYAIGVGISFIATSALYILASKQFSPSLIKGSLGMNTVSAIFVSTGVTLLLLDAGMNGILSQDCWAIIPFWERNLSPADHLLGLGVLHKLYCSPFCQRSNHQDQQACPGYSKCVCNQYLGTRVFLSSSQRRWPPRLCHLKQKRAPENLMELNCSAGTS